MPSRKSQEAQFPAPTVLPLAKYSYATVSAEHNAPLPWKHVSERDMYAVFAMARAQTSAGVEETQRFRIARDAQGSVAEDVDLLKLAAQARAGLEQSKISDADRTPDVHVIVRPPTMAMKFPLTNGQAHRFQIRFSKDTDYYTALSKFAAANCPLNEAGPSSPVRGLTRPASLTTSRSNQTQREPALTHSRPASAIPSCNSTLPPNIPSVSEPLGPSQRPALLMSNNFQAPMPDFQAEKLGQSVSLGRTPNHGLSQGLPQGRIPEQRPISTIFDHDTVDNRNIQHRSHVVNSGLELHNFQPNNDTPISRHAELSQNNSYLSSSAPERLDCYDYSAGLANSTQQRKLQDIIYQPQPSTAPVYRSQTNLLPPRRELPFIRPPSSFSPSKALPFTPAPVTTVSPTVNHKTEPMKDHESREYETSAGNSPEKKSSTGGLKKSASRGKRAPAKKPEKSVPSVEDLLQRDDFALPAVEPDTAPTGKKTAIRKPPARRTRQPRKNAKSAAKIPPSEPSQTQNEEDTSKPSGPLNDAEMEDIVPDSQEAASAAKPSPRKPLSTLSRNIRTAKTPVDKIPAALLSDPLFTASPEFANYADLPVGERRRALEAFMCEQLENPAFRALCKDMGAMWQTVVFGREVGVEKEW